MISTRFDFLQRFKKTTNFCFWLRNAASENTEMNYGSVDMAYIAISLRLSFSYPSKISFVDEFLRFYVLVVKTILCLRFLKDCNFDVKYL